MRSSTCSSSLMAFGSGPELGECYQKHYGMRLTRSSRVIAIASSANTNPACCLNQKIAKSFWMCKKRLGHQSERLGTESVNIDLYSSALRSGGLVLTSACGRLLATAGFVLSVVQSPSVAL